MMGRKFFDLTDLPTKDRPIRYAPGSTRPDQILFRPVFQHEPLDAFKLFRIVANQNDILS